MTMINQQKPSLEEVLAHHGVKGQKWGVRRKNKPTSKDILDARARLTGHAAAFDLASRAAKDSTSTAKARASAKTKADKIERMHDSSQDRITASRLTRGEKAMTALGIVLTGPAAPAVAVGIIGGKTLANHLVKKSVNKARAKA